MIRIPNVRINEGAVLRIRYKAGPGSIKLDPDLDLLAKIPDPDPQKKVRIRPEHEKNPQVRYLRCEAIVTYTNSHFSQQVLVPST